MNFYLTLPLLALLLLSGSASAQDDRELHLLCWSEYVPKSVLDEFTLRKGAKVQTENYNSNEQMLEKLHAKPGYYDVIQPSGFYVESLAQAGELQSLDHSRIPNLKNLDDRFRHPAHDPDQKFSVPWLAGTVGIVINSRRVRDPVKTWSDVFSGNTRGESWWWMIRERWWPGRWPRSICPSRM